MEDNSLETIRIIVDENNKPIDCTINPTVVIYYLNECKKNNDYPNATINGFIENRIRKYNDIMDSGLSGPIFISLVRIFNKFEHEGIIIKGHDANDVFKNRFIIAKYTEELFHSMYYDFVIEGFPRIIQHYEKSIFPLNISYNDGTSDIGTSFLCWHKESCYILTARHCIKDNAITEIGCEFDIKPHKLFYYKDNTIDIAAIDFEGEFRLPQFLIGNVNILDEIITSGYPPIPGFKEILISEKGSISNISMKSTKGVVNGVDESYLSKISYLLISARVKGGNSGGPVINSKGQTVGIVTNVPLDSEEVDSLGYGLALRAETIRTFFKDIDMKSEEIECKNLHQIDINKFKVGQSASL